MFLQTVVQGLTGEVRFDNEGLRTQFSVDIVELTSAGLVTIGNWKSGTGLLNISRLANGPDDKSAESFLSNQTFIVITSLVRMQIRIEDTRHTTCWSAFLNCRVLRTVC